MPDDLDKRSWPPADPSIATNDAVARATKAERDYVDGKIEVISTRLNAIDEATKVLAGTIERMPDERHRDILHLRELNDEKFFSVAQQFKERDTRSERASRDGSVAVEAAFAAQKEAAARQDEANAKAIDKSEKATAETIKTNQELVTTKTDALTKSLDEAKLQISKIESTKAGVGESTASNRANIAVLISVAFFAITVVGIILTFIPKK